MTKRVFLVHGWSGAPDNHWFPWLSAELTKRGFQVEALAMPNPSEPKMETWIPFIADAVGEADKDTYFIGHSIGCQAILRYLETLPNGQQIGGAVFVAGWYHLRNLKTEEEKRIAGPWVNTPRDDAKIRAATPRAIAIFSDNDQWVLPENHIAWREKVGATIFVEHAMGHFTAEDGVTELPAALKALLEVALPPEISIDEFAKMDIRIGKIVSAERIAGADKLLKLQVELGGELRTIVSGIAQHYQPEELSGKLVPVLTNLAPRKMKGVESQGMILFAIDETNGGHAPVALLPLKDVPPGSPVQ